MTRWSRLVPLLAIVMLVLAACGPSGESQSAAASEPDGSEPATSEPAASASGGEGAGGMEASGELFAYGFGYETGDVIAQTRVDVFNEQYPDVDVTFSESGFDDQGFLTALASGDAPDVVNLPRNKIGTYIARGVLQPLTDCMDQAGLDPDVFYEGARNQVTVDGEMYAVPEFYNTRIWIINNAAFEDAGLDPESFDFSDWDAIAEANEALVSNDGGLSRIGIDPKLPEFLSMWVRAAGGQVISDDGMESLLDTPEVAEAVEFGRSLIDANGGINEFTDFRNTWDFFGANNQVAADQIGAWPMEQWYLNVLAENSPDAEITVKPFVDRDGNTVTLQDGNSWAITADTDNADAACAFITTMVAKDTWVAAAQARADQREADGLPNTGVYTANSEADDVIFNEIVDLSDYPSLQEAVQVVLDGQDTAFGFPPSPAGAEFQQALTDAVNRALSGDVDVQQALSDADAEAQDAIDAAAR